MPVCVFCDQENPPGLTNCRLCAGPLPPTEAAPLADEVFHQELIRLLTAGQRVQAVAAYRRRTGVDLNRAVQVIDELEQDHQFDVAPSDANLEREVIAYLERGEKIGAIKHYREKTGADLKDAKEAVEAVATRVGLATPAGQGCLGMLLAVGFVLTLALAQCGA